MNDRTVLALSLLFAIGIPFLLPHMHDRYFYAGDVLTVVLAVCIPWLSLSALLTEFGSYICYLAYFTGYYQRIGKSNVFLTNDKGALAVLLSILLISLHIILSVRTAKICEKRS